VSTMEFDYQLSCESTVDLPYSYVSGRGIPVLFYKYVVDGETYVDDMLRDPEALPRFYAMLDAGKLPQTSQINEAEYTEFFEPLLQKGNLLHIAFGSGMTQSVGNAMRAAEELREKYPDRKLIVIDSLCSSSGYGLLVDVCADMRDAGKSMEEVAQWALDNRNTVHHQFYSTNLTQFRRSGRVSGPTAAIATILNICPIMRLNDEGRIIAYDKVRGKKAALKRTLDTMEEHAQGGAAYSGRCFVCHSDVPEDAEFTAKAVMERFPNIEGGKIRICDIGTIIGAHSGKGTVAVFFFGDERTHE